ncbi:hypothetical protein EDB86DRAFT_832352 [Lactarius hatsudake]|nr:hypothetical protein EDB86DRAFT_832352 [Lactarius hatsudake]
MFLSRLGMLALHRGIRSIGHTLKSFILRCLFYWPHVFRNLRRIWSLCSRTSPKDIAKKKGGQARPLFPRALGVCHGEGYNVIYASRDFNRANALHFTSGPGNAEVLHLSPVMMQSQSVPPSPYPSHTPSLRGSLRRSDRRLSASSNTPSIASSYIANDQLVPIRRVPTPLTLTHARVTSTHFAGAPPDRPRSWSRSPSQPQSPLPSLSPLPSPLPPLHLQSLPESSTQKSPSNTHIMNVVPSSQDTSEGYLRHDIMIFPPPRSQSIELDSQFTTSRRVSVEANPVALADGLGIWPDGKMRSISLMHSEQVSRYVNKGDVSPVNSEYILRPMELDLPQYSYAKSPEGWAPVTHPGGAVYFYHAEQRRNPSTRCTFGQ